MIVVWGTPSDQPVERMLHVLAVRGADVLHVDDRHMEDLSYDFTLGERPAGWLEVGGRRCSVDDIEGMYVRPLTPSPEGAVSSMAMAALASSVRAGVVNRPFAGRSNWSKPFQLTLLRNGGFYVPDTLVTTDVGAAQEFLARHGRIIYKSVSGIRSIVASIDSSQRGRLDQLGTGPVQFQRWIDGTDVRVHVVGDQWFATEVVSDAVDYRYPAALTGGVELSSTEIPFHIGRRLVELTDSMGLLLSGTDLRVTPNGDWYAFEMNPSPGFSFYEDATGQPIALAIADLLCAWPDVTGGVRSGSL